MSDMIELKLRVPETPSARDIVAAYARNVMREAEHAEEATKKASRVIFDAELAVANAQRIALAAREKAARLRAQSDALARQLEGMIEAEIK